MSKFADFIRNASPEQKEAVYMEVMRKATESQNERLLAKAAETRESFYKRQFEVLAEIGGGSSN